MSRAVDDAVNKLDAIRDEVNDLRTEADHLADRLESGVDKALEALAEVADQIDTFEEDESRADVAEARIAELEAKLAIVRDAHERYRRTDGTGIERDEYDEIITGVVEVP